MKVLKHGTLHYYSYVVYLWLANADLLNGTKRFINVNRISELLDTTGTIHLGELFL